MNISGEFEVCSPKDQFDAFVLLPLVHYVAPDGTP